MTVVQYDPKLLDGESVRMCYTLASTAFRVLFGHAPREDAEELLSKAWKEADARTTAEADEFYRHELLMTEEGALWHSEKRGQRMRRAIHAGTIAAQLGFNSFAEVGAGIGTDGIALAKLGFENKYLAEINRHSLMMIDRVADVAGAKVNSVDLSKYSKEQCQDYYPGAHWLYSSDVFEHILDLEGWLDNWIDRFRCVIVYAPFGTSEKNAAHTDYSKAQFNAFMDAQGFEKVKVLGLGIPPMVYLQRKSDA